jgi:transcriptional repressor NrdR
MRCPSCQHCESKVLESRAAESGQSIRRRRECLQCKHRFTSYERIEFVQITVIKRNREKESFDRCKVLRGIIRACEKTGIEQEKLEILVDDIESELQQKIIKQVSSSEIGDLVLQRLKPLSEVAYIRFASVYRQFQGINDFIQTLKDLSSQIEQDRDNTDIASDIICDRLPILEISGNFTQM